MATGINNPIGDLLELFSIIRLPYLKNIEKCGKLFKCVVSIYDSKIESEWLPNQKEAEQSSAIKILDTLPVRKVDDSLVQQRGSAHELSFRAEVSVNIDGTNIMIGSEWSKKKMEAKRELLQKLAEHYFKSNYNTTSSLTNGPSTNGQPTNENHTNSHSTNDHSNDATSSPSEVVVHPEGGQTTFPISSSDLYSVEKNSSNDKLRAFLRTWQAFSLPKVKQIIGPLPEPYPTDLDAMLTVAFIHSSFASGSQSQEVLQELGLPNNNYERLEFYGDAVLGYLASKFLMLASKSDTPHDLTIKKQQLVREDACCNYMKKLSLDNFIIQRDILQNPSAKVICDVFEAMIGALYLLYEDRAQPVIMNLLQTTNAHLL